MESDRTGWWDVGTHDLWTCPECEKVSPVEDWEECEVYCENCGDHEGRKCPLCGEAFEHVWGASKIEKAIKEKTK